MTPSPSFPPSAGKSRKTSPSSELPIGFIIGAIAGFAVTLGLVGLVAGYGAARLQGTSAANIAQVPAAPSVPDAPAPTPPPAQPLPPIDFKRDHILGNKDATIALVEYSDFECPFCKSVHPTYQQVMKEYGSKVMMVYRHFPLSFHQNAQKEAEASECVAELGGNDAFWKFHDYVFDKTTSNGTGFALDQLPVAAKAAGVDEAKFKTCLDSGKYAQLVQDEETTGGSAGVDGTPGNFVYNVKTKETTPIVGAVPFAQFKSAIDAALAK